MQNDYKSILNYYIHKLENRFWKNVDKTKSCWNWNGPKAGRGYGNFVCCGKQNSAHRIAWILKRKSIPDKLHVLHHCDNRLCVNPKHLWLGTNIDNMNDKILKRRHAFGENHSRAKLTEKQVKKIRAIYKPRKMTAHMLSRKYGVTVTNIRSIIFRKTWRHI